ncbi:MAG: YraN family protein [Planctomycetota bacterium]|nr:YraN family protein [Planctomycetota bacterium]
MSDKSLGLKGEKLAARYLRRKGLKILARNYRCPPGEVDIIALDRSTRHSDGSETIVFVEVKTRSSDRYVEPESAVDAQKRLQLTRIAEYYLSRYDTNDYAARFDVVSVVIREGEKPQIRHITDAC